VTISKREKPKRSKKGKNQREVQYPKARKTKKRVKSKVRRKPKKG